MTYLKRCSDYLIANREAVRWEVIGPEVKGHNIRENAHHGLITEWIDAADVKMAKKTRSNCIPPTTRGTHGRDQLQVRKGDFWGVLKVIPTT